MNGIISNELRKLVDPHNECCCEHCLVNKCKEWASNQGYMLTTVVLTCDGNIWYCEDDLQKTKVTWKANTEPEAIFKACQWILEIKEL